MCLANPAQIVEIDENAALVRYGGEASSRLVKVERMSGLTAGPGDWVLVHAGLIVGLIAAEEVETLLELLAEIQPGLS